MNYQRTGVSVIFYLNVLYVGSLNYVYLSINTCYSVGLVVNTSYLSIVMRGKGFFFKVKSYFCLISRYLELLANFFTERFRKYYLFLLTNIIYNIYVVEIKSSNGLISSSSPMVPIINKLICLFFRFLQSQ